MYRFSASNSHDLQIRALRMALFNYLCAKQTGTGFILRIEDEHKAKNSDSKENNIHDSLALFGIGYDHLYYQSNNFKYHLQFASFLMDKHKAFACFCTEEELKDKSVYSGKCITISQEELLNNSLPFVIRIKKPENGMNVWDECKGQLSFTPDEVDDFIIMSKEKYPMPNFANACDDMLQGVKYLICEEEQLLDMPRQACIKEALGFHEEIKYTHIPSLLNTDEKLSATCLLDQGFMPEAILNYLVLLGNHTPLEIFSMEEALSWFDITKISKIPAPFDMDTLRFINREHIKRLDDMELSKRIGFACENIGKLAKLYTQEASTTQEIKQKMDAVFAKKELYAKYTQESALLQKCILNAPYCETFDAFEAYLLKHTSLEGNAFYTPLRYWLTGAQNGPELALLYPLIKTYLKEIVR